jgi:uncharacterized membrane protein
MRHKLRILLAAAATFLGASAATAQAPAPLLAAGTAVDGPLTLGSGRQVPLPGRGWIVAADTTAAFTGERLGAFGRLRNTVLFRMEGQAVTAVAEVHANLLPTTDGWGVARDCERRDLIVAVVRYKAGWDASCFFIGHTLVPAAEAAASGTPEAWQSAVAFAARSRFVLPSTFVTAGFRSASRSDVVDLRVHFAPAALGLAPESAPPRWRDSPWQAERIVTDQPRLAAAQQLGAWALPFSALVDSGLKGRLDAGASLPMPGTPAEPAGDVLATRAATIEALRRDGTITEAQYEEQMRRLAERGLSTGSEVPDPAVVALYKTLSYRPIVSFLNFWIDLYWIGTPFAAGVLEVLQIVVNSYKFYMHEIAWNQFVASSSRPDAARVIDFRYIGRNA